MSAYAELAVTTNFSFLRGASHPEELVSRARELGLAALGIADRNSVAGLVRAHTAAKQAGVKLVAGARLVFADATPDILAFPRDRPAWGRLTRLLSVGKSRAEKGDCILFLDDLLEHAEGLNLIVVPERIEADALGPLLVRLREASRVWLAARMLYCGDDHRRLARLARLAAETRVPLIAVNDVLYHAPERRALQDVVTCIRAHVAIDCAGRRLEANAERHLKSGAEMARLFRSAPQALNETLSFVHRCRFSLDDLKYDYPDETRQGYATPQEALRALTEAGARQRYPHGMRDDVRRALDHELAVTAELNYAPYFLTVHDIVRFARSNGILCQGRGSAANSVICYCLGITEVDPERVSLLFERFVSVERREPPDIDVDFEHERREEVIQHIYRRYGRDRAGLAATVICYRGRSAIREVGKVFGLSDDTVGALAGTLWGWSMEGVTDAQARRAGLDSSDPRLNRVMALARELMGFPRHLSQHVGGFVITRARLDEVVPIENAAMDERTVIEWDKDDLNDLGILKVDVLGLGMLSCLRRSFDLLKEHYVTSARLADHELHPSPEGGGMDEPSCAAHPEKLEPSDRDKFVPLALSAIPADDRAVYRMIQRADTIGVFQIESRAQMSMLPRLKPETFYDLVIEVAIVRPGPIQGDMVHPYLKRREKLRASGEEPSYPSPSPAHGAKDELKQVLAKTLGVPLFQEQAMRIAIVAAGFPPAKADRLRRAMATFKRVGTIDRFRDEFVHGMTRRGYPADFARRCFQQIEGFGEYGFPESHAASFALLVYASAWIKCRYPDVFAAALLNSQPMGFYAPAQIVRDAQEHGIEVRPVDVNFSDWDCSLEPLSEPLPLHTRGHLSPLAAGQSRLRAPLLDCHPGRAPKAREPGPMNPCSALFLMPGDMGPGSAPPGLDPGPSGTTIERLCEDPNAMALPRAGRGDVGHVRANETQSVSRHLHPRHADMQHDICSILAVRLGLRQVSGLSQAHALTIESVRGSGFDSVRDLWLRTRLPPAVLERLAQADAFRSLGLTRRDALWAVRALKRSGDKDDLPLFRRVKMPELEPDAHLPAMLPGEEVIEDYRHLHLSLKAHPVSFLRPELDRRGILPNARLASMSSGPRVTVAGLVLVRQRPGDAKAIFMTLEDETGIANAILWLRTFELYRPVVLGARLISVTGTLQNESGVIHVVADRLADLSGLLRRLSDAGPAVDTLARCDEVKRPNPGIRSEKHQQQQEAARRKEALTRVTERDAATVLPKGRNFH